MRTSPAPAPHVVIAWTMMQTAMEVRAPAVHLVVSQIQNRMARPTKACVITQVVRNQMAMLRNEMKVASKTMLKRWMSPAAMRLAVKLRTVRCLPARWPRVQSLSQIPRTVKVHQTPTPGDHALGSHTQEGGKGGKGVQTQHGTIVLAAVPGPKTARRAAEDKMAQSCLLLRHQLWQMVRQGGPGRL